MNGRGILLITAFVWFNLAVVTAQNITPEDEKLDWWGNVDGFINQQDRVSLDHVTELLKRYPPTVEEPVERRAAMLMIDGILHEEHAAHRASVQEFLHSSILKAVMELENTDIAKGARIWKMYNHGFVIRTATVTFGFDLVRAHSAGAEGFSIEGALMRRLIDQCDAMFISHRHGDHADAWVARAFIDQGKPVVSPPEVWKDEEIHVKITHLERDPNIMQFLNIQKNKQVLKVVVNPGHQGKDIENNVTMVITPEGLSFAHTGDQSGPEKDWDWIDASGAQYQLDVLLPNCWTPNIHRMVSGFNPRLVITGHENEMGHTIDHREPNWLTYTRLKGLSTPYVLMTWGESYNYK